MTKFIRAFLRINFSYSLCKCLIVLSSCLIQRQGPCPKPSPPALEEFLPTGPAEFAKGKIYREMRVSGGIDLTFVRYPEKGSPEQVFLPDRNPYEQELRLFADCIVGKGDPALLVPERAREALTLSIATQQSLREHCGINPRSIR